MDKEEQKTKNNRRYKTENRIGETTEEWKKTEQNKIQQERIKYSKIGDNR